MEAAHVARDLGVLVGGQRDQRDEAHGEEGPARDAARRPVAAVAALRRDGLGAFEVVLELLRAEGQTECHLWRWAWG